MPSPGLNVPVLGDQVPRRGNAFTHLLALLGLRLTGWRWEGEFPNIPKFVLVVAPHTSNWDFPMGIIAMFSLGLRGAFLAKSTLFRWPLGPVMRWLGGISVDRSSAHNVVFQSSAYFRKAEQLVLIISPEGTRKRLPRWRTGFFHVARGAGVPVVPLAFDYSRKVFRVSPALVLGDDLETEFARLQPLFHAGMAKHPEQYSG